jgi:hypothetical protein
MAIEVQLPPEEKTEEKREKSVRLDFSRKQKGQSPFKKAATMEKRLKLFLWGHSGAGKTTLSIQFPKPAIIDLEGGADLYGDSFEFDVLKATTPDEAMAAVDWLLTHKHTYKTLVVDPITAFWDSLQKKWSDIFLRRNKGSKGYKYEFYDLQPKDWLTVKAEFKEFIRKLIALDMNVIVTAREKTKYKEGSFMVAMGETFDGEKSLPYMFDTIVRMYVDDKGRHMGTCLKDRSNKLPKDEFECSYPVFERFFGKKSLDRASKPIEYASDAQKEKLREYIREFGLTTAQVERRLAAYDAETIDDLTRENAEVILSKFEAAIENKNQNKEDKENA